MPKSYTFPTLLDECKKLSISDIIRYVKGKQYVSNELAWRNNGQKVGSIGILINAISNPFITLNYKFNGTPIDYKINLVSIPSNLGKGAIWYFICPNTGKRCRKLYLVEGYFLHRSAFKGCMYESQTYSKANRTVFKKLRPYFKSDDLYAETRKKYFKKTYKGKLTKKYLKIIKQLE